MAKNAKSWTFQSWYWWGGRWISLYKISEKNQGRSLLDGRQWEGNAVEMFKIFSGEAKIGWTSKRLRSLTILIFWCSCVPSIWRRAFVEECCSRWDAWPLACKMLTWTVEYLGFQLWSQILNSFLIKESMRLRLTTEGGATWEDYWKLILQPNNTKNKIIRGIGDWRIWLRKNSKLLAEITQFFLVLNLFWRVSRWGRVNVESWLEWSCGGRRVVE